MAAPSKKSSRKKRSHVSAGSTNESVRVMVRFRPTNKSEQKKAREKEPWKTLQNTDKGIRMIENQLSLYNIQEHGANNVTFKTKKEKFTFDALLPHNTTQVEAFEKVAQQICDEIIQGYNGTIFVYGQSGSGKTHTMYGPEDQKDSGDLNAMGVIPQSCAYIFEILNNKEHPLVEGMLSYKVECEFAEIYNETLKDLLELNNKPQIKEVCINAHKDEWRVIVRNLQRRQVRNLSEVLTAIRVASGNRTVRGTNLNATSSRSHMVMKLIVKIETADGVRTGVGNFSDLAGSEKVKKTAAVGQGLVEAKNILKSLSTLSRVIEALVKNKLPPFKDSKLTFMLKDSLGGNCKTALLIACSPHVFNRDETVRSLRFGQQCRKIQNKAKINAVRTKTQLIAENEALKAQIEKLKHSKSEYIMADDAKSMEKEKQKLNARIQELEHANQSLSDQIIENNQEKAAADEQLVRINNDFEELKLKTQTLTLDMEVRNTSIESYKTRISESDVLKERLMKQTNDLKAVTTKLNQTNSDLNVENERLQESNTQQMNVIQKLKKQYEKEHEEQQNLQNKWKSELDSKKSHFSQQEMQLSQTIESLQLQMKQSNEAQQALEREMNATNQTLKQSQHQVHQLQDEKRTVANDLKEEKEKTGAVCAENEELKLQIKDLLAQLGLKQKENDALQVQVQTEKEGHFNEMQEQKAVMNQLEFEFENKCNELQRKHNEMEQMKKEHRQQVNNLRFEMEALQNLNEQLQEENKTASDVMGAQEEQLSKHSRDTSIIQMQLTRLQSHYAHVVSSQIESDQKMAEEMQKEEAQRFMMRQKERLNAIDSDSEPELLMQHGGPTPGGDFEQHIVKEYAPQSQDIKQEEDQSEEEESDEDVEQQQNAMFGALITRRESESKQNKKSMRVAWEKQQRELQALQAQIDIDREIADQLRRTQMEKEEERQRKLKEEERKAYIEKHYISADKIPETSGINVEDEEYMRNKLKKKRKKKQYKSFEDDANQYEDPNDGAGLIIMDDDSYLDDEY